MEKSECGKGLARHNERMLHIMFQEPLSIHAHLHKTSFLCMSQPIDYIPLKQPCEQGRCKAKSAYWDNGRLFCKQGHRQDVEVDKDILKLILFTDYSRRIIKLRMILIPPEVRRLESKEIDQRKCPKVRNRSSCH